MRGRSRLLLAGLVLVAVTLMLVDARGGESSPLAALRRGADTVLGPAQRAVGGAAGAGGEALGGLPRIARYREDNERLRRENDELRRGRLEQEELEQVRRSIDELLRLPAAASSPRVLARVIGRGSFQPFGDTVVLDAGSDDGVREGQTVAGGRGLVGRTVRVGPRTSTVVLLTDPGFTVAVRLVRAPRSFGLASGTGDGRLRLRLVDPGAAGRLRPGDALLTAGSEVFVPGLPVGQVTAVEPADGGGEAAAVVEPFSPPDGLDLVQVLTPEPGRAPRVPLPPAR